MSLATEKLDGPPAATFASRATNTRRRRSRLYFVVGALLIWCLIAWLGAQLLIVRKELTHADALVVMAGSATFEERNTLAAQLYKEGRAPRIILTDDYQQAGWSQAEQRNPFFVELAKRKLQNLGVPGTQIDIVAPAGSGTRWEAESLLRFAEDKKLKSLLVVTSSYHSRRALWIVQTVFDGSDIAIGLEPVRPGIQTPKPYWWWLRRKGWLMVPTEYVKIFKWLVFKK
jgi:uncharacterized SAM-binding protein YcdF (DUF218 family)